jgi:hypothetical protein
VKVVGEETCVWENLRGENGKIEYFSYLLARGHFGQGEGACQKSQKIRKSFMNLGVIGGGNGE